MLYTNSDKAGKTESQVAGVKSFYLMSKQFFWGQKGAEAVRCLLYCDTDSVKAPRDALPQQLKRWPRLSQAGPSPMEGRAGMLCGSESKGCHRCLQRWECQCGQSFEEDRKPQYLLQTKIEK